MTRGTTGHESHTAMKVTEAVEMLAPGFAGAQPAETWIDLGSGEGTFTRALARLVGAGSTIHAVDTDAAALGRLARHREPVRIETWETDFVAAPWPVSGLDGVLIANALHNVADQRTLIETCRRHLRPRHRFLVVEYDTTRAGAWVPYPVDRRALAALFRGAGYGVIDILGTRPSIYRRAELYVASVRA